MVVGAAMEKDGDRLAQIRARTSSMAKEILDCCTEMCSLHQNEFKFLKGFREDLKLCNAANMKDIADCLQWEERARTAADEKIEKATDAAILRLQARMTEDFALQRVNLSKLEPATTVSGFDDLPKIMDAAQQDLHAGRDDVSEHISTNERINELDVQMQARLTGMREEIKDVINLLEQEEKARVRSTNEFDHKQVLQQSCFDDLAAKVETLEALCSLQQQQQDDCHHQSSDVDNQLLTKHLQDFQLLQHQVQEMQNNERNQCSHHQLLEDNVMEQIQKQTTELCLLQSRLDQLDDKVSSVNNNTTNMEHAKEIILQELSDVKHGLVLGDNVMEQIQKQTTEFSLLQSRLDQLDDKVCSMNNTTTNMEHAKEIILQELGDVKQGLERCVIQTGECQGALRELRTQVDAESFPQQQLKGHATLVEQSLENQEHFRPVVRPRFRLVKCMGAGSSMGLQRISSGKLEPAPSICSVDDYPKIDAGCDGANEQFITINEQINELGVQLQARLTSETNLQEEIKDVISLLEQEEKARVRSTNEFDHKQVLQQSCIDDLAAKVETLEALVSLHQNERDDREHHSSDVDHQLLAKHLQVFHLLEEQVQEMQKNMIERCVHHQSLEDDVMKPIEAQKNELSLLQVRVNQLDEKVNSTYSNTDNAEHVKDMLLQELGDVKHGLEGCVSGTAECKGALRELRAQVDAESFRQQEQFKLHAVSVEQSLEQVKSLSETLNSRILECQDLKTNLKSINDMVLQEPPRLLPVVRPSVRRGNFMGAGSPTGLQRNATTPSRTSKLTPKAAGSELATTSVFPGVKQGMRPREDTTMSAVTGSTTPRVAIGSRGFGAATSFSTTPVSTGSFSAVPALIRPPPIQTSSAEQISVLDSIDNDPELNNCVATPRAVIAPKAALTNGSVATPLCTSKSTPKVAELETVNSAVLASVKHDMQPWDDSTTGVTGTATPSTATPTSRTPRGFSAASSASMTPASGASFSAVPTFFTPTAIQTSSADQISVLKVIDDNPELHNRVATAGPIIPR